MSGRSVRSMRGCWSSSSSRFLACMVPSWVEPGLDRVDGRPAGQPDEDQEDRAGREAATRRGIRFSMP